MILWVDDVRHPPDNLNYYWERSVNSAKTFIQENEDMIKRLRNNNKFSFPLRNAMVRVQGIEYIDIDHDAGDYAKDGGDFIQILNWMEETGRNYPIRIHSMNPVGVQNMRAIIEYNGWREIR